MTPLDDANVRRALAMALDRQKLIDDLYGGNLLLANGILPPGIPGFSEDLQAIPFDPAEAKRLLASSQYADDFPEITYIAVDRDGEPPLTVQFMIDSWKENLGVEVSLNLVDPEEYYYNLEDQEGHLYTYGWVADYPDPENFLDLLLHSEAHDSRYVNASFDALLEQARETQDREARLELFRLAEQLLIHETGIIPAVPRPGLRPAQALRSGLRHQPRRPARHRQRTIRRRPLTHPPSPPFPLRGGRPGWG